MTTRIKPIDPPYSQEISDDFEKLMPGREPLLLMRTLAKNHRVMRRLMAGNLLDQGTITIRQRELAVLRVTALCRAEQEWGTHVHLFREQANWTRNELYATVHGTHRDSCWNEQESLIIQLADQLHAKSCIEDTLFLELSANFDEPQIIELVMVIGNYHQVSFLVNVAKINNETFAPRFPEPN